nr:retrovirus-related Pol polyprotein from transposon TNT 1-94 [Tanacetum cinerariifolium]
VNLEPAEVQVSIINEDVSSPPITSQSTHPLAPQDRWTRDKHIELVNIISEPQDAPYGKTIIGTKWIFMKKMDKNEVVINKKSRLVAQGFREEEGIDYDETFAPVARLEATRIVLAYATYMGFIVYQMYVKSAFLNGIISEEVFIQQPPRFESSEFPNHVCKLDKALYGLKQAPKGWYETPSSFLIQHKFIKGTIDNTLFTYKTKSDFIIVHIYVDDIIFGSTSDKMSKQFSKLMTKKYEMSMMGEFTYFLGFQVKQDFKGISICQGKYVKYLLKGMIWLIVPQ